MRNIIITGGELFNKGAQAMTFVAVHELKSRFPNHKIYLLSEMDLERPAEERQQYAFEIMGWNPIKFAHCQHNPLLRILCQIRNRDALAEAEKIYKNCDAMVDISGYALGANWSVANNMRFLNHLEFAYAFGIPVYLMSQSFGPFDYGKAYAKVDARCRKLLPKAKAILAREQDGVDALKNTYGLTNVWFAPDLVLNNKSINLAAIFKRVPRMDIPEIADNSIAVIPNGRNLKMGETAVLELYAAAIQKGLAQGKNVYLLHHATSDASICVSLKNRFCNEDKVILLENDFSCLEYNELVKRFDYLVASRFHSIVHAYKNGVPCVALGWAKKYEDLLTLFGQREYLFDVRQMPTKQEIVTAMDRLDSRRMEEASVVLSHLSEVQQCNVFDVIAL